MIEVVQIGLGPIGIECARLVLSRPKLKLVGCADTDPELAGKDLNELLGRSEPTGIRVQPDRPRRTETRHEKSSRIIKLGPGGSRY